MVKDHNGLFYLWILAKDTSNNTIITRTNAFNLDNIAPTVTLNGNNGVTITQGATYTDAGAAASDNIVSIITDIVS